MPTPLILTTVTVYRYLTGENAKAPYFATKEAIHREQGERLENSHRTVGLSEIDKKGFYPKPGIWVVEIFDVVSREDGNRRVSVPHGEYMMREVSAEIYSLSGDQLPFPFTLSLVEVATYLPAEDRPGKMKIVAGIWP